MIHDFCSRSANQDSSSRWFNCVSGRDYMLSQTTIPLTVDSFPTGTSVYVDGILIGKAPITKKVSRGGTHKIRCTLSGYNDYTYDYVVAPFNSAVNAVKGDWRCLLTIRNGQATPTLSPANTQQPSQQVLPNTAQPLLQEKNTLPSSTPKILPPQKPKGFFSRFWQRVLFIFGKR